MAAKPSKHYLVPRTMRDYLALLAGLAIILATGTFLDSFNGNTTFFQSIIFLGVIILVVIAYHRVVERSSL